MNPFVGALYFPSHKLCIAPEAYNQTLKTDIHAVAESDHEKSPGLPHGVLAEDNANELCVYLHANEIAIQWLNLFFFSGSFS